VKAPLACHHLWRGVTWAPVVGLAQGATGARKRRQAFGRHVAGGGSEPACPRCLDHRGDGAARLRPAEYFLCAARGEAGLRRTDVAEAANAGLWQRTRAEPVLDYCRLGDLGHVIDIAPLELSCDFVASDALGPGAEGADHARAGRQAGRGAALTITTSEHRSQLRSRHAQRAGVPRCLPRRLPRRHDGAPKPARGAGLAAARKAKTAAGQALPPAWRRLTAQVAIGGSRMPSSAGLGACPASCLPCRRARWSPSRRPCRSHRSGNDESAFI
jgi:hypothetical protein